MTTVKLDVEGTIEWVSSFIVLFVAHLSLVFAHRRWSSHAEPGLTYLLAFMERQHIILAPVESCANRHANHYPQAAVPTITYGTGARYLV